MDRQIALGMTLFFFGCGEGDCQKGANLNPEKINVCYCAPFHSILVVGEADAADSGGLLSIANETTHFLDFEFNARGDGGFRVEIASGGIGNVVRITAYLDCDELSFKSAEFFVEDECKI